MAIIAQRPMFGWEEIESVGDLGRLKLVLESLPDEQLMGRLEAQRGKRGRDDYPVRPMWNALIAGAAVNLLMVTLGNVVGGSVLVADVYWVAYLRNE